MRGASHALIVAAALALLARGCEGKLPDLGGLAPAVKKEFAK